MFNSLPRELQSDILSFNPRYKSVSTFFNEDLYSQQLFNKKYCSLPISLSEALPIIKNKEVFIIYLVGEENLIIYHCRHKYDDYWVTFMKLTIDNMDVNQHNFRINIIDRMMKIDSVLEDIRKTSYDMYYDLETTYEIYSRRRCDATYYTLKDFNELAQEAEPTNLWSSFDQLKSMMVIHSEWHLNDTDYGDRMDDIRYEMLYFYVFDDFSDLIGYRDNDNLLDIDKKLIYDIDYQSEKNDLIFKIYNLLK